jgi:nitrate/TMAO reductase-like tetraheme cytochrome c subunit
MPARLWMLGLGMAVSAVLWTSPAHAQAPQAPTTGDCLTCHDDKDAARANGTSVAVLKEKFDASIHAGLSCVDCHADLATAELPHAEKLQPVACRTCHDDTVAQLQASAHFDVKDPTTGQKAPACVDCHGPAHEMRPKTDAASKVNVFNLPATCGSCHGGGKQAGPRGQVLEHFQESVHGRGLSRSGLQVSANCTSCHGAHDIRKKTDPASRVHRANVAKTCATCHNGIEQVYETSIHAQKVAAGNTGAAVCSDCHTSHEIQRTETAAWRLEVLRECGNCHTEKTATYRDTYHGQVTNLGFSRIATCASCHGSHDILPASNPASKVSAANVVTTCQSCHPNANENFAKYDPHADKHDAARSPVLHWTYRFMQVLLAGVFLFFGTHTLLWLPRSWAMRRQRAQAARGESR